MLTLPNQTRQRKKSGFSTPMHRLFITSVQAALPMTEISAPTLLQEVRLDPRLQSVKRGTPAINHLPENLRLIRILKEGEKPEVEELLPLRYPFYDKLWTESYKNNWQPESIGMDEDRVQWNATLGSDKYIDNNTRHMVRANLSFFGTAEQLIGDNALMGLGYYVTMPEARNQLLRMGFEESIHSRTFAKIIKELGLSTKEIYQAHKNIPVIDRKDKFMKEATVALSNRELDLTTQEGRRTFMEAILAQIIMEGILFYGGFVMNLSLQERGLMPGLGQQYAYIMRDESLHLMLMREMFNHFKDAEWKDQWTTEFQQFCVDRIREAVEIETEYAQYAIRPELGGVQGLPCEAFVEYAQFLANRRANFIDLPEIYPGARNPFPWLEKRTDLPKDENFFESHRTDYADISQADF